MDLTGGLMVFLSRCLRPEAKSLRLAGLPFLFFSPGSLICRIFFLLGGEEGGKSRMARSFSKARAERSATPWSFNPYHPEPFSLPLPLRALKRTDLKMRTLLYFPRPLVTSPPQLPGVFCCDPATTITIGNDSDRGRSLFFF